MEDFKNPYANVSHLVELGEKFILYWYGGRKSKDLNSFRYIKYTQLVARQNLFNNFELEVLPPTSDAAKLHIKRVYFQVQEWLGNNVNPENWGWIKNKNCLEPEKMSQKCAPEFILNILFCNCKTNCSKLCSCKKYNLRCTTSCIHCIGQYCTNATPVSLLEDEAEIDI